MVVQRIRLIGHVHALAINPHRLQPLRSTKRLLTHGLLSPPSALHYSTHEHISIQSCGGLRVLSAHSSAHRGSELSRTRLSELLASRFDAKARDTTPFSAQLPISSQSAAVDTIVAVSIQPRDPLIQQLTPRSQRFVERLSPCLSNWSGSHRSP